MSAEQPRSSGERRPAFRAPAYAFEISEDPRRQRISDRGGFREWGRQRHADFSSRIGALGPSFDNWYWLPHSRRRVHSADAPLLRTLPGSFLQRRPDEESSSFFNDLSSTATLIGFAAILMWSLLSLLTVASGTVPPFQLAAMTFAIGGGARCRDLGCSGRGAARGAEAAVAGLGARRRRTVRLSRAVLPRAAPRAAGRGAARQLSLAAADRAVLGAAAGRAAAMRITSPAR